MDKFLLKDSLKGIVKIRLISIDNNVFSLHYRATTLLFIVFSILVTGTQFFGDPIRCIQSDDIPVRVINTYCWVESTFSLPKALDKSVGEQVVYPGVEQYKKGDEVIEHAYYQWVCFVLFLQGMLFYIPKVLWKSWEGGKIKNLLMELNKPIFDEKEKRRKCRAISVYIRKNFRHHTSYSLKYAFCECLNFINVVGQIYLINRFLGGEFTSYGPKVIQFTEMNQINRTDPMIRVFPRMTKCTFHKFGSSGSVQTHDALCLLPLNIVNEKIYVFLWFWLVILAVLSGIVVCYRIVIIGWRPLRVIIMRYRNQIVKKGDVNTVVNEVNFGDWFILYLLSKNMHGVHFRNFMNMLAKGLKKDKIKREEEEEKEKKTGLKKRRVDIEISDESSDDEEKADEGVEGPDEDFEEPGRAADESRIRLLA